MRPRYLKSIYNGYVTLYNGFISILANQRERMYVKNSPPMCRCMFNNGNVEKALLCFGSVLLTSPEFFTIRSGQQIKWEIDT
jgi:hypothetical protein